MNTHFRFLCKHRFSFFWDKCPVVQLLGHMVIAHFFKEIATLFHSGSTILHPHQQHMSDPASPNPGQHLVLSLFFISAILVGMQRHLVIFICINIMATNIICLFHFVKYLFTFLPMFSLEFFFNCRFESYMF